MQSMNNNIKPSKKVNPVIGAIIITISLCIICMLTAASVGLHWINQEEPITLNQDYLFESDWAEWYGLDIQIPSDWQWFKGETASEKFHHQICFLPENAKCLSPADNSMIFIDNGLYSTAELYPGETDLISILNLNAKDRFPFVIELETPNELIIDGFPAASGVFLAANPYEKTLYFSGGDLYVVYLVIVNRQVELNAFIGLSPVDNWIENRPIYDEILKTLKFWDGKQDQSYR